jgi:signal transduction histidine kinase/ligand-binding sensor domain-containing protein
MNKVITICCFFVLTALNTVFGQQLLTYNTADGLPQSFVYSLENDSLGKVWIGTGNGIASYNGNILQESPIPYEPGNRFITTTTLDINNQLWFGHYIGNLSTRTSLGWKLIQGVNSTKVVRLLSTFEGMFVVHQNAIGRLKNDSVKLLFQSKNNELQFQDAIMYNSQLFIASNNGLWRYFNHNFEQVAFSDKNITSLSVINEQMIIGLSNGQIFGWKMEQEATLLTKVKAHVAVVKQIRDEIWVGTKNGVFVFTNDWKSNSTLLKDQYITDLLEDIAGNIWISTYGDGVFKLPNAQFSILPITSEVIIPNKSNGYLIASNNRVISVKWQSNSWKTNTLIELPKSHNITSLFRTENEVIIGTKNHGIQIVNVVSKKITAFEYNNFLLDKSIHDIVIDNSNVWWISVSLSGVLSYNPETEELNFYDTSNGLTHNDIYHLQIDNDGGIWMTSKGSGIAKLTDGIFEYFSFNEGLNDLDITGITAGKDGKIVLSSSGGGVNLFKNNVFHSVTYSDGLPTNFVQNINHINDDVYWLSTPSGLCQFNANNLSFKTFDQKYFSENLAFNECNIAINDGGSSAAFSTTKGVLMYRLNNQVSQLNLLDLAIVSLEANKKAYDYKKHISLPFKRQDIVIATDIVSYGQTSPVALEYKLYESDTTWIGPVYQGQLNFSGLRDDNYSITIRIANKPETAKKISLTILKPFWKTWWFILITVILVLSIIYVIFRLRIYRLKQYNKELEEKVADRTLQLSNRNKQLEQFTYTISHDLKNPAINLVELIKILSPNMQEHSDAAIFNMLEKTAGNMYSTLIELLNVLKATQEKGLHIEELNFEEIINDAKISIKHSIEKCNATVLAEIEQPTTLFHKPHLQSIVYNLLSNAIKYQRPGVDPVINIKTYSEGVYNCINIRDNGLGLDMENDGEKLFGMFQRLHDHVEGTGVGLHLIHSIIEQAGGKIEVESEVGVGTTFTVKLPKTPVKQ